MHGSIFTNSSIPVVVFFNISIGVTWSTLSDWTEIALEQNSYNTIKSIFFFFSVLINNSFYQKLDVNIVFEDNYVPH